MSELEVIKIEPLNLPADVVWQISGRQHIALKDFYVYVQEEKAIMYVNAAVPEKDVEKFIKAATYKGKYIIDDTTEMGKLMDYIYETYGFATYNSLHDYHQYKTKRKKEQRAKEKVQNAIPLIEKLINTKKFDENMIYEAYSAGKDIKGKTPLNRCGFSEIYVYYLGYLAGSEALQKSTGATKVKKQAQEQQD